MNGWIAIGAAAAGLALAEGAGARYLFRRTIMRSHVKKSQTQVEVEKRWERYMPEMKERRAWLDEQPLEKVSITSFDGLRLSATVFPAEEPSEKTVVCFHGYTSSSLQEYASFAPFYHAMGYNMVMPDARAHGESDGEYIGFGCLDRYDCRDWVHWAEERFGGEICLHGVSMGGATVLMASGYDMPAVKAIVADCGFTCAWDIFATVLKKDYHMPPFPVLTMADKISKLQAGYGFRECVATEEVARTEIPILFIHGEEDDFVPAWMGRRNFEACASDKRLLIIPGAGHAESYHADRPLYEATVQEFLEKHM